MDIEPVRSQVLCHILTCYPDHLDIALEYFNEGEHQDGGRFWIDNFYVIVVHDTYAGHEFGVNIDYTAIAKDFKMYLDTALDESLCGECGGRLCDEDSIDAGVSGTTMVRCTDCGRIGLLEDMTS